MIVNVKSLLLTEDLQKGILENERKQKWAYVSNRKAHLVTGMRDQVHKRGHCDALNQCFVGPGFRGLFRSRVINQLPNVPELPILSTSTCTSYILTLPSCAETRQMPKVQRDAQTLLFPIRCLKDTLYFIFSDHLPDNKQLLSLFYLLT